MYKNDPVAKRLTSEILDRREMLRVKVKSLAAEARIIRAEEKRSHGQLRNELHLHRVRDLRHHARNAHVAYGLIKGRTIDQMEPNCKSEPDWVAIEKMVKKYGPVNTASIIRIIEPELVEPVAA